jgi:kynurenine formamidase
MPRRLVDISSPLKAGIRSDPPHMLPKIEYMDHHQTAPAMAEYMGVRVDQLPDGEYAAVERVEISTHNGTHMDAPWHFFSTMNHALKPNGEPSWRIDDVPLDWCFQPGVKLDFRHLPDGYVATAGDVEAELADRTRGARGRHRCLELGRAVLLHAGEGQGNRRLQPDLGGPPRRS